MYTFFKNSILRGILCVSKYCLRAYERALEGRVLYHIALDTNIKTDAIDVMSAWLGGTLHLPRKWFTKYTSQHIRLVSTVFVENGCVKYLLHRMKKDCMRSKFVNIHKYFAVYRIPAICVKVNDVVCTERLSRTYFAFDTVTAYEIALVVEKYSKTENTVQLIDMDFKEKTFKDFDVIHLQEVVC